MPRKPRHSPNPNGRPRTEHSLYAESLGIDCRALKRLGGMDRLKAMPDDARAVILAQRNAGAKPSRAARAGGLKARGYLTRKRGIDTQPQCSIGNEYQSTVGASGE